MFDFGIEDVKRNNPLPEVMKRYGVNINRKGFCCCPIHNDKRPSMKVYPNNTAHCFSCGADLDVFDFVQRMEGCDFKTAYHLLGGVDRELTKEERQRYREEMQAREREAKRKEAIKKQIFSMESAEATIAREIHWLSGHYEPGNEEFWDELARLEKLRQKCEIQLCKLREKL